MKKYKTNTAKLLLASLCVPVVVSTLPVENVFAAENEIPILHVYENNGVPQLSWATEMLQENILTTENFENSTTIFSYNSLLSKKYPNTLVQKVVSNMSYQGSKSLWLGGTTNDRGNFYNAEIDSYSNISAFFGNQRLYLPDNSNLSVSLRVKAKSDVDMSISVYDSTTDAGKSTGSYMKNSVAKGTTSFYVTNPQNINVGMYLLTNKTFTPGNYGHAYVQSVDYNTGLVTLKSPLAENFNVGDELKQHTNPTSATFKKSIQASNDWQLVNLNSLFGNELHSASRGNVLQFIYSSSDEFYIDDVKFGYATEVEVFREGKAIYRGYLSDFTDKTIKDTVKPNEVTKVNTTIGNDFKVNFVPVKPLDNGVTTSYTIQAIAKNGTRSAMSAPQSVTVGGQVTKYKYSVTKSATAPTTLENTTNGLDFSLPVNTLNIERDYVHVQSVDATGNVSSVQTFKLADIVDKTALNDLYNKLKQVEDNNNHEEFLEFMDEVEAMYGTNIPEDVKSRIQQLAGYYDENTAFLELLEGDFSLTTRDITSFGKVKLTAEKQILKTNFADNFTVIDARGTQQGWKVNVSATPFVEDTFEGFVGEPTQLPIGTLAVNNARDIEQIGIVHESKLPKAFTNDFTIIDSGEVTVLNANKGEGMGEFKFNFGEDALSMVVDSTTAKIDNKNYPKGVTPYTSTITWNLITGP